MDPSAQQIPPGEQIGPYQVVRRLGAGGMGEVYLARHRHLNRDAAVKVLLAEISMNQTVVARFFTEARATAQLRHPNIVEIFDCDVLPDGRAYIVMEYLRGESLRGTLDRQGKLCPDYGSIAAITGLVADALQAAHENGIVHRDLKPDNTFLAIVPSQRDGLTVKVLDFGIAKLLSGGDRTGGGTPTRTGSLIGTPLYMSPEQCRGIPTIDHRADIYSLGCMVFEMVVGQPPFVAEAPGDILMAHIIQNAPPLSSFQADVPREIDALVAQMLAKDPAMRPQSMAEVVATIEALLGIRKSEFAGTLRRPAGFPEMAAQMPTQILPPEGSAPVRPTPSFPKRESPPNRGASPGAEAPASRPKITPPAQAAIPVRHKSTPASSPGRQKDPVGVPSLDLANDDRFAPEKPKWAIPVVVIALVVGLGGGAAYLLTRPQPTATSDHEPAKKPDIPSPTEPAQKQAEFVPPVEVTVEIISSPGGATVWVGGEDSSRGTTPTKLTLPRSTSPMDVVLKAPGYLDKQLSLDASRDQTMNVKLQPREGVRPQVKTSEPDIDKSSSKKERPDKGKRGGGKSAGKSAGGTETTGGFKPVGD
jgi:serine/threonine-protein kinase